MRFVAYAYLVLLGIAIALPFPAGGPEAGIFAVVLSAPWSLVLVAILDSFDPALIDRLGLAIPALGGLVNFGIMMWLARRGAQVKQAAR